MKRQISLGCVIALAAALGAGVVNETSTFAESDLPRRLPEDWTTSVLYVALGDSTVYGVGAKTPQRTYVSQFFGRLRSVYPEARMVNLGVGGATAADVVDKQVGQAIALRPDVVTLSIGPNDITRGREVREYERDIETIFRRLTQETAAVVMVNLIPDLTVTPRYRGRDGAALIGKRVLLFNGALERQARVYGVEVVDLYTPSRQEVPRRPELISADGYHPSDQGYARWAELMWQGLKARIAVVPADATSTQPVRR